VVQIEDISDLTKNLAKSTLREAYTLIDTVEAIPDLLKDLINQPEAPPSLQ
jgi:hypothetical protein